MVNIHFLKKKLKNINKHLSRLYRKKYLLNEKITELEHARLDTRDLINNKR